MRPKRDTHFVRKHMHVPLDELCLTLVRLRDSRSMKLEPEHVKRLRDHYDGQLEMEIIRRTGPDDAPKHIGNAQRIMKLLS
jgi:hypothetical protein